MKFIFRSCMYWLFFGNANRSQFIRRTYGFLEYCFEHRMHPFSENVHFPNLFFQNNQLLFGSMRNTILSQNLSA
ncbi:hypothetical protein [Altibacter sp.]|uniref:hypothetical protein n=1 Tax=Altibacter sp. TaxID=2024823 RepID=UPI000C919C94|nr:hypothetical protein [Altibacter sp.]MAP54461.1 hypothetical protein [Altibacter sp.]